MVGAQLPPRCPVRAPSARWLGPQMSAVSAGDSGLVPASRHRRAQGPEHGGGRGEQVWCQQLPVVLPALSERLRLQGPRVSVVPLPRCPLPALGFSSCRERPPAFHRGCQALYPCESPEESLGRQAAPSAGAGQRLYRRRPGDRAGVLPPAQESRLGCPARPAPGTSAPAPPQPWPRSPAASVHRQTCWQAAGLARTQRCLTLPPFGFLIAEKFIRRQTIASSKTPRKNNQAIRSPTVRLPLLNGRLNGARWRLGALSGQRDDGCQPGPAGRGARARGVRACPRCPASCPSGPPCRPVLG